MYKVHKHRIYPNKHCRFQLSRQEGCNRKIWNETLNHMIELGYWLNYYDMAKFLVHTLKQKYPFLYEVSHQPMQATLMDLHNTIKSHVRKNNPTNRPKFKTKIDRFSCRFAINVKS